MATIYPGQVFPAYIKPQHNVHGPIRFSYKGMWPDFRANYFLNIRAANDDAAGEAIAINAMAILITKWNLEYPKDHPNKDKAGKPVPITEEAIKNDVMVHVRNHMLNIITWSATSDVDPESPITSQVKLIEQKASGKSLAEIMAEADAELVGN
jgi:hypothetical protein